ncbi:hypothetical protein [Pseudomonas syringae]|uniref:hypothetical protein n=1 Tax=Pseudomonas syringae TaxID=317 RepID=UPI001FD5DB9D
MTAHWAIAFAVTAMLAASWAIAVVLPVEDVNVSVVLNFVKHANVPSVCFDPTSFSACKPKTDAYFTADNPREFVIALKVPRSRILEPVFDVAAANTSQVILESNDLPFRLENEGLIVSPPPIAVDTITAAEVPTHIFEPDLVLRFEHVNPARRAGPYAHGLFLSLQRAAANVLEFALLEVVRDLGLGRYVETHGLGQIQIINAPPRPRRCVAVSAHALTLARQYLQIAHY